MEALFLALIQQLNGAVFTLIVIVILMFYIIYKAGGIITTFRHFERKNDKADTKFDEMTGSLAKIQATTDLLYQAHLSTIQARSPIALSDKGKEIASAIQAEVKINEHWQDIKAKLEEKNPTNPYDIQTVAMDISRDCFDKIFTLEERNQIKTYAFSIGLNLLEIYPIFGVLIRNKIFQERNIPLGDVDKFDPAQK
jgi:hypothetical protein